MIVCHYCNHRQAAPEKCPNCDGKYIYYVGEGTEQIEGATRKLSGAAYCPHRLRHCGAARRLERALTDFGAGKLTRWSARKFARVTIFQTTLVGVVSVDAGWPCRLSRGGERSSC